MNAARRERRAHVAAVLWPFLCALVMMFVCSLLRERVTWPVYYAARDAVWWSHAVLAVVGSATACVAATPGKPRLPAAFGFAFWAAVVYLIVTAVYLGVEPARR